MCFCAQGTRPKLGICIRPNLWIMGGDSVRGTTQEMGYPWTQVKLTLLLVPLSYLEGQLKGYKNLKKSQIFLRQPWEGVLDCTKLGPICMQYSVSPDGTVVGVVGEVGLKSDKTILKAWLCLYVICQIRLTFSEVSLFGEIIYGDNAFCMTCILLVQLWQSYDNYSCKNAWLHLFLIYLSSSLALLDSQCHFLLNVMLFNFCFACHMPPGLFV